MADGKGHEQGKATVNAGATVPAFGSSVFTTSLAGTYDVDPDGTGDFTATLTPPGISAASAASNPFDLGGALVIDQKDDREVRLLSIGSNRVLLTGTKRQRTPKGGFSNANLRGDWGFSCQGTLITLAGDPTAVESPLAVVGLITADGKGDFLAKVTANVAGAILQSSFSGNIKVAKNGFITAAATSADPLLAHLRGVMDSTNEFELIPIDPGKIISCTANKQEHKTD